VILIGVSGIGVTFAPVPELHKFSSAGPEDATIYEPYVVDDAGTEFRYDARAAEPLLDTRLETVAGRIGTEYGQAKANESACYLLAEANEYRTEISKGTTLASRVSFPRHEVDARWDQSLLSQAGKFTELRVYEVSYSTSEDGMAVTSQNRSLVYQKGVETCS
jgi:hypothetical protein